MHDRLELGESHSGQQYSSAETPASRCWTARQSVGDAHAPVRTATPDAARRLLMPCFADAQLRRFTPRAVSSKGAGQKACQHWRTEVAWAACVWYVCCSFRFCDLEAGVQESWGAGVSRHIHLAIAHVWDLLWVICVEQILHATPDVSKRSLQPKENVTSSHDTQGLSRSHAS